MEDSEGGKGTSFKERRRRAKKKKKGERRRERGNERERTSKRDNAALMRCRLGSVLIPTLRGLASPRFVSSHLVSPRLSSAQLGSLQLVSPHLATAGSRRVASRRRTKYFYRWTFYSQEQRRPCDQVSRYTGWIRAS